MADYRAWRGRYGLGVPEGDTISLYGVGPGRTSFVVTLAGDEPGWVKAVEIIFNNHGGGLSQSVTWLFKDQGLITLSKAVSGLGEDTIMLHGLGAGADDVIFDDGDLVDIICAPHRLAEIREVFLFEEIPYLLAEVVKVPRDLVAIDQEIEVREVLGLMGDLVQSPGVCQVVADFYLADKWV